MNTAEQFLVCCRMTCMGGSEKGTCACKRPIDCTLQQHPKYDEYRDMATRRMVQHLKNCIGPELTDAMLEPEA